MEDEVSKIIAILESFLGSSKNGISQSGQIQFNCPRCADENGGRIDNKFNLECNIYRGVFQCWRCSSVGDSVMSGSLRKLIKMYGSHNLLADYIEAMNSLKESKLYQLNFITESHKETKCNEITLPKNYHVFKEGKENNEKALDYLLSRGIDWLCIERFSIGYTSYSKDEKSLSNRIILPSIDKFGDINYWTGRDFTDSHKRMKYFNTKSDKTDIIFNEGLIQWDADITLVEGPFDSIVVPNSIPLLGKALNEKYAIYQKLFEKANANINIFLDGDAKDSAIKVYRLLNTGKLYNRIKFVPLDESLDPSLINQLYGKKGITDHLKMARQVKEIYLL